MAEQQPVVQSQPAPTPPKKSSCWYWGCGIFVLLIIIVMVLGALRSGLITPGGNSNQEATDKELSKQELIDYFVAETTVYPGFNRPIKLMKWNKDIITVSIADTPPENGTKVVDKFISKFNSLSSSVQLQRVDTGGDIIIYFQASTQGAAGKSGPSTGADTIIDHAKIRISQEAAIFEQSLSSVLSHEMFHALGFTGHYQGSDCRLMSPDTCGSHLTINEERLIQMMYASNISDGLDETAIRAFFEANWSFN